GIADDAQSQFDAGPRRSADKHAAAEPARQVGVASCQFLRPAQTQQHAAHIGLVRDTWLVGLEHDGIADRVGGCGRRLGVGSLLGPDGGDAVLAQQPEQRRAAGLAGGEQRSAALPASMVDGAPPTAAGAAACWSRCDSASRPVRMPSRTGIPAWRSCAASSASMTLPTLLSTATGLSVRAAASSTAWA